MVSTRCNPSPSGLRALATPQRATRSRRQPVAPANSTTANSTTANSTTANSITANSTTANSITANSTTAPPVNSTTAPPASDDEPESLVRSSSFRRMTRAMSRDTSRSASRSISPPIDAIISGTKKMIQKVGKSVAKATTKSRGNTQQRSDAKTSNKLQKKNPHDAQPLGAIAHEKRSHSQVSLVSQASDNEESRPSKKSKKAAEPQVIDSTQTVFNTPTPNIRNSTFHPHDQHIDRSIVAAPTESFEESEEDLSRFSRLDDGNQSTPRPLEQPTSAPTAEAEAASSSLLGRRPRSRATKFNPRLLSTPHYLAAGFRKHHRSAPPEDEESFNIDDISIPNNPLEHNRKLREALLNRTTKKEKTVTPKADKVRPGQARMPNHHPLYYPAMRHLKFSSHINHAVLESAITIAEWVNQNPKAPLPTPEKLRAMLEAHKAELSKAEATNHNHTPEDVFQDTSSRPRDEPATSMTHESPREMGVADTPHRSSPSPLASQDAMIADNVLEPNETLEQNTTPETPPQPPTVGRARATLLGISSMITSPFKRIFVGNTPANAGNLNGGRFNYRIPGAPLGLADLTPLKTRRIPPRQQPTHLQPQKPTNSSAHQSLTSGDHRSSQRQQARENWQASAEDAEDESNANIANHTLAQDGQKVGAKRRRYSGTYCFPSSPLDSSFEQTPSREIPTPSAPSIQPGSLPCFCQDGHYHVPYNRDLDGKPYYCSTEKNPFPKRHSSYQLPAEIAEKIEYKNFYSPIMEVILENAVKSRHARCSLPYRNNYWAQVYVIQTGMSDAELYWDDRLRKMGWFDWCRHHRIKQTDGNLNTVFPVDNKNFDEHYYTKMNEYEFPPAQKPKRVTYGFTYTAEEDEVEEDPVPAQSAPGPSSWASTSTNLSPKPNAQPAAVPSVLQENDGNQRPPPTPKPTNAVLPKTPFGSINHRPSNPSNLRAVMTLSPPIEQGTNDKEQVANGKENLYDPFVPSNKPFKWTMGGEPEIRVMEDTKEPIPMDDWKEAATALLHAEGMEPFPDAFW